MWLLRPATTKLKGRVPVAWRAEDLFGVYSLPRAPGPYPQVVRPTQTHHRHLRNAKSLGALET